LNSSVYRARVAFIIVSPSLIVSYGIRLAGARSGLGIRGNADSNHPGFRPIPFMKTVRLSS
jgi:hypothetical protein